MAPPSEVPKPALFLAISKRILTSISTEIRHTVYRLSKHRFNITASTEKRIKALQGYKHLKMGGNMGSFFNILKSFIYLFNWQGFLFSVFFCFVLGWFFFIISKLFWHICLFIEEIWNLTLTRAHSFSLPCYLVIVVIFTFNHSVWTYERMVSFRASWYDWNPAITQFLAAV